MSEYVSMFACAFSADMQLGPTYETVPEFDRTADAGLIDVLNVKLGEDLKKLYPFPPAVVNDLEVTEMSYENKTVTLTWTAVGDYDEQETGGNQLLSLYSCSPFVVPVFLCLVGHGVRFRRLVVVLLLFITFLPLRLLSTVSSSFYMFSVIHPSFQVSLNAVLP